MDWFMTPERLGKIPSIPFAAIRNELNDLLTAIPNMLEREWPTERFNAPGAPIILRAHVLIARTTYNAIRFLCADEPPDALRKLDFAVVVSPLARSILDSLCTIVFLFEDLVRMTVRYHKGGWRELFEEHQRFLATYGADPDWKEWLGHQSNLVAMMKTQAGITAQEEATLSKVPYWPIPGKMLGEPGLSADRKKYLQHLQDWYYKELSQDAHGSWPGMARRAAALLTTSAANREALLMKYKSDVVTTSITLLLALLSELEVELKLGFAAKLKFIWGVLTPIFGEAKEVFELRYATRL